MSRRHRSRLGVRVFAESGKETRVATKEKNPVKPGPSEKDRRLIGFQFPGGMYSNKTPFDYMPDKNTGLRLSSQNGPWGISVHSLRDGIEAAVIPPLAVWENGIWLTDIEDFFQPVWDSHPYGTYDRRKNWDKRVWVTHGDYTPGEFVYRVYMLPDEVADYQIDPKHPMMWPTDLKKGSGNAGFECKKSQTWGSKAKEDPWMTWVCSWQILKEGHIDLSKLPDYPKDYKLGMKGGAAIVAGLKDGPPANGGYGYGEIPFGFGERAGVLVTPKPAAPSTATPLTKTVSASLPTGVRIRHACGHWFSESALANHAKVCAVDNGEGAEAMWAVACDKECGCEYIEGFPTAAHVLGVKTLDHVSRCKPGYPPPIKEKEVKMTETVEAPEPTEPEPTEPASEPEPEIEATEPAEAAAE